jgi:hypothetical protein
VGSVPFSIKLTVRQTMPRPSIELKGMVRYCVNTFLGSCLLLSELLGSGQWRTISNEPHHYKISFPENWTIWPMATDGVIGATSYPRDRALEGGLVPAGEAGIDVVPLKGESKSLAQWANGTLKFVEEVQRKRVALKPTRANTPGSYLQVESRDEVGPGVYYRKIADFYFLKGRPFTAELEFIEGDPRESIYRSILDQVVRSISAVEPPRRK